MNYNQDAGPAVDGEVLQERDGSAGQQQHGRPHEEDGQGDGGPRGGVQRGVGARDQGHAQTVDHCRRPGLRQPDQLHGQTHHRR